MHFCIVYCMFVALEIAICLLPKNVFCFEFCKIQTFWTNCGNVQNLQNARNQSLFKTLKCFNIIRSANASGTWMIDRHALWSFTTNQSDAFSNIVDTPYRAQLMACKIHRPVLEWRTTGLVLK